MNTENGKNLHWATDVNTELPIVLDKTGMGSMKPVTVMQTFFETAKTRLDKYALHVERGGKVLKWTWNEYQTDILNFAKAMHVVGVSERKSVNIMGHNSPEWVIGCLGGIFANCITTGVYISNLEAACLYQAENSEAELILVDGIANLKKY
jgi:long-subunit acyl-CoA synthetase (AMP-forming)